ncbi:MAG TPA: potassium-transporting ATPase subunit KdpC [Streptosporangiaceae bacterium]|jgi:K+-transporting ATPase ATPase C chain
MKSWFRQIGAGLRALLVLTAILGIAYPLVMTGFSQVAFHEKANGSLIDRNGNPTTDPKKAVGSQLLGQNFDGDQWFHPRPSAAGDNGYDGLASGASNLGPNSPELKKRIAALKVTIAKVEHVAPSAIPPDALTASGSGLDPDISPAYAAIQVNRVARENHEDTATVRRLVRAATSGRDAGFIGAPHVNVLKLNIAVEKLARG